MVKGQVALELRENDAFGALFGRVYYVRGRQYDLLYAWRDIDDIVKRQLGIRGRDKTFTFKAARATWIYEPVLLDPMNADPVLVQFHELTQAVS